MKILIEAHHPAHIHFWKYPVQELLSRGHDVLMIGRDRDVMKRLLAHYDWIPHVIPTQAAQNNQIPVLEFLRRQWAVASCINKFRPDVFCSLMGSYAQSAGLAGIRNIIFTDSEFQHFNHRIAHPFASEIHTPDCFYKDLGRKQIRYHGIHELAFLHPDHFKHDAAVLDKYPGLEPRRYVLIRLSAWNTLHDRHHQGVGDQLSRFVEEATKGFSIVISAEENQLPESLREHVRDIAPEDFHQLQAHTAFILSEGASTAAEGACLGVPSVYINSTEPRGYLQMLEKDYGLVRAFREADPGLDEATNWINRLGESEYARCMANRERMLNDHINVASHVVQVIEGGIV
jgi:predicted glycosyltransferase